MWLRGQGFPILAEVYYTDEGMRNYDFLLTEIDTLFRRCYNQNQVVRMFVRSRGT